MVGKIISTYYDETSYEFQEINFFSVKTFALLTLSIISISTSWGQTLTPLRVAYVPVATWLPAWVAKEKGIFKNNGLDVTLSPIQNVSLLPPTNG
jgi:ABC-type nitrate/sulfonate/bicarbonate transport system substrate-binding protein